LENKIIELFRSYYIRANLNSNLVEDLGNREVAIWPFNKQTLIRHLSFKDDQNLKKFLMKNVPVHLYYSIAKYEIPSSTNMEDKRLIEAEVVFDIDIDHVNTSCKMDHDIWICKACNNTGLGFIEKCNKCGSLTIDKKSFVCNNCLEVAKNEVIKLIDDFLIGDFGLSKKDIRIFFSGNRGYHVHVINREFSLLDSRARNMIVDYVKGISVKMQFKELLKKKKLILGGINSKGFLGRLAETIYDKINNRTINDWKNFGLDEDKINKIQEIKNQILSELKRDKCNYSFLKTFGKLKEKFIQECIKEVAVDIDERVTVDVHRLIRYPNSLHGKTALRVTPVDYANIYNFDPFTDSLAFLKGSVKISYKSKRKFPKITMNNEDYDLNTLEGKEIPLYLGLYLYLSGHANIIEFNI